MSSKRELCSFEFDELFSNNFFINLVRKESLAISFFEIGSILQFVTKKFLITGSPPNTKLLTTLSRFEQMNLLNYLFQDFSINFFLHS